jgi:hypothetical protein
VRRGYEILGPALVNDIDQAHKSRSSSLPGPAVYSAVPRCISRTSRAAAPAFPAVSPAAGPLYPSS